MKRRYTILLKADPEQGGYWVEVPALAGVYSYGDTKEEALAKAREAIEGYIEALELDGEAVPEQLTPYETEEIEVAA